ncbi:MAG: hypothetical protein HW383_224 [Candidatus Magasanikbacteria bacterium]|nr:hypothetical protein [Candidatus Magasanikbacteria bacterium]
MVILCPLCRASGSRGAQTCYACKGMAFGVPARGKFYYWNHPIDGVELRAIHTKRILNLAVNFLLFLFILATIAYLALAAAATGDINNLFLGEFWKSGSTAVILFWCGALALWLFVSRLVRLRRVRRTVEAKKFGAEATASSSGPMNWGEVRGLHQGSRVDITETFTDDAVKAIEQAYFLGERRRDSQIIPAHLFLTLLDFPTIGSLFYRLGTVPEDIKKALSGLLGGDSPRSGTVPLRLPQTSPAFQEILFSAYENAYEHREPEVDLSALFSAAFSAIPELAPYFEENGLAVKKLLNVIEWARIKEALRRQYFRQRQASRHRPKGDVNKAMTAMATPYLNQFSDDMTRAAAYGNYEPMIDRGRELEEIFRVLQGGGQSVLLVGESGVGKMTLIQGLAQMMVEEKEVPPVLQDKRLVHLNMAALLAGADAATVQGRLLRILQELERAGNIVLFVEDVEKLMGISAGEESSQDVADVLGQELSKARFLTIASTSPDSFRRFISNSKLGALFQKVEIAEMNAEDTVHVLEAKAGYIEYEHQVWFSYDALEKAAELSSRYLHEQYNPSKAIALIKEAAAGVSRKKGKNAYVTGEDVAVILSEKAHVPVSAVTADEKAKLLALEEEMHGRVIGQDEAVTVVAAALRRARAEIRAGSRPIANFLFLGPTGVGKTELAKTLAAVYFGDEKAMIRLDMSEYQDVSAIQKLIGRTGEQGTGALTEAVRQRPFSIVLLDEMEKAEPNILNLFLQVMDDGRLTDSVGRTIDFTNVILIATSNAGTQYVQEQLQQGVGNEQIKTALIHSELKQYFRPEFLNRFDAIVLFKPLLKEQIVQIARLMLGRLARTLEQKGIILEVTPAALEEIAAAGFDPIFGARPLRRVIQDRVENKIADVMLRGEVKRKDVIFVDAGGRVTVKIV